MNTPVEFAEFGGLDVRKDPQSNTGAVDCRNVMFDNAGMVHTRPGFQAFYTAAAAPTSMGMISWGYAAFTTGSNIYVVPSGGGGLTGSAATADTMGSFVSSPDPTVHEAYYMNASGVAKKIVASPTALSAPAGVPDGTCLGVQTPDRRLVVGNAGHTTGKVAFSNPGAPETFSANDYVTLPGAIISMVSWNDQLFVFTLAGIFLFYGNSTDATGNPIFNYRFISNKLAGGDSLTAGPDGVYYAANDGAFKTTGGAPIRISDPIDPIWIVPTGFPRPQSAPLFTSTHSAAVSWSPLRVQSDSRYVYFAITVSGATSNAPVFVFDTQTSKWTYWELGLYGLAFILPSPYYHALIVGGTNSTAITQGLATSTTDNGTAIASHYRSGFANPGPPGVETIVREWLIDASSTTGSVTFSTATNDSSSLAGASVTVGTSPAVDTGRYRVATKGRNHSWQVGASSGQWSLSRVMANIRGAKSTSADSG